MNRKEELDILMQEIEKPVPELEHTLERAKRRLRRRNYIVRPVVNFAACFVGFVLLVNFCTPVAYACSKVPILRELAEAVTFSRSLSDAVDNEYVQPIYLEQTDGDVTATVEYLIVDRKQVNVFFRLESEVYPELGFDSEVLSAEGEDFLSCGWGTNNLDAENGQLRSVTIDFIDEDVPDSLRLKLAVNDMSSSMAEEIVLDTAENLTDGVVEEETLYVPKCVAQFDFLLEFDPEFTATGKVIPVNQTVILEGQEITITEMEVYPTFASVNVEAAADNTAWLKGLNFYIETDWGMKFEPVSNGTVATGAVDSPSMVSFRADSNYFYDAKHLKVVITGAEWLRKDMEKVYINLKTGETGQLPDGTELYSISEKSNGWVLSFKGERRKPNHSYMLFNMIGYDAEGTEYDLSYFGGITRFSSDVDSEKYFFEEHTISNYPYDELWLSPTYSHVWTAEEPITVTVQ